MINEINIKSYRDFVRYTDQHKNENDIRLYRGQQENWPLESKLFRLAKKQKRIKEFYDSEKRIFNNFKNYLISEEKVKSTLNDWEVLSIGQHYGLPTRLIDWTSNPLVALWFAFEKTKENNKERVVWGLVVDKLSLVDFKKDNPFSGRFVKVFEPNKIDIRIKVQNSWFSVQNPEIFGKGGDGLPHFNDYNLMNEIELYQYLLVRIKIPNEIREEVLQELNKVGINNRTIFPGREGVCKNIEWEEFK